ncbi:type I polyketide synthase [Methylobacter sp.]|uniref:type I polyketide synthase n=1 Tax=Methylobacter sp. TaxID=2051955 RepID=UPI0025FBF2D7|nr:type I polyketide synthase [Methylobacter sp.]
MAEQDKQQALMRRALDELRELRSKLAQYQQAEHEPIAVIGLGCRFPGGCDSPEALWQFLSEGKNARSEVPAERWPLSEYYDAKPQTPGKISSRYGAFLSDIAAFDADFFAIAAREAEQMDPQQRLLLETSWQTFERTGIHPKTLRNSRGGVFIGCMTQEYSELIKDEKAIDVHTGTGNAPSLLAGRLAYYYGLQGPAMVIDTACSSSLLAVHLAVKSLRSKEIDMALAGGVNLQLSPRAGITESQAMMLAEDGLCKTFDDKADGIGRGDGVGLVVLKRLSDALQAGDPICAVIKGSAANHDGRSSGLTVPSERAQEAVLKAALADAALSPSQVGYIEAHGTGTSLGDPIEVSALSSVLGQRSDDNPLYIGSLKTNFGHTEGAAGIAGFIKAVLMLQNKMLPPHLNFTTPSSHIPWQSIPIKVLKRLMPWPVAEGQNRVAGVSAFGLSGTNVHVLLAESPEQETADQTASELALPLKLSANSAGSLAKLAGSYQTWLQQHDLSLDSVCYQAAKGRADFNERAVIVGTNKKQFEQALSALSQGLTYDGLYISGKAQQKPKLAMIFSGQGSQYPGMAQDLYQRWPVFKQTIDQCAEYLRELLDMPLQSLLFESSEQQLQQTCYAQPAIFAVDYALYRLWQSWGIEPDAVMGHSLGEYVAACVAGVLSLGETLQLVAARAQIMQQAPGQGGMLAVSVDAKRVSELLSGDLQELDIAAINSAQHCVLSGQKLLVDLAQQRLEEQGINCTPLQVSHAFHSRLMEPVLPALQQKLAKVTFSRPFMTLISNSTGQAAGDEMSTAAYWLQHCREPVLFAEGIKSLQEIGCTAFLECGAKPVLSPMLSANAVESKQVFASVRPKQADSLLHCAAQLYVGGFDLDWQQVFVEPPKGARPVLPVYPFSGKRYWLPDQALKSKQSDNTQKLHPLMHKRLDLADTKTVYFESWLTPQAPAYLSEHRVFGLVLMPLAALLEMVLAAAQQLGKTTALSLKNISIEQPLILSPDEPTHIQIQARENAQHYQLSIFSRVGDASWQRHLTAETDVLEHTDLYAPTQRDYPQSLAPERLYQQFQERDIVYGDTFKVLSQIDFKPQSALTRLKAMPVELGYSLHPAVWDGCMQTAGVALGETEGDKTWLPVSVERIDFYQSTKQDAECHAQVSVSGANASKVDIVLSCSGTVSLKMQGVTFQPVSEQALAALANKKLDTWLYKPDWQLLNEADLVRQPDDEYIFCIGTETAKQLIAKLQRRQSQLTLVSPENLQDQSYWQNHKTAGLNAHLVYCAQDFIGSDSSACLGFLALIQAIEKQSIPVKVTLLTNNAAAIDNVPVCPKQNAVVGLLKTAALEFPQRHWQMLDVADMNVVDEDLLAIALSGLANEQQLALQAKQCYAARLMPYSRAQSEQTVQIVKNKTYLVTGGSGALGFAVVELLVKNGADCVVIVSRSGLSGIAESKLQQLIAQGARVVGVAADLAQQQGIDALLEQLQSLPALAGVVHAAGVLNDGALLNMTQADFNKPWSAKVNALQLLDKALSAETLDFFVVFSSLAALTGAPGQGNYAAANAYVDALMLNRKSKGLPALTINWSGWSGVGMLADAEAAMSEKGFDLIQPAQGLALFERLLSQFLPQVAVMPVRWPEFFAALPFKAPNFYQPMLTAQTDKDDKQTGGLIRQLNQAGLSQRLTILEQAVRQHIAQVLRNPDSANLAIRQRLFDIGFDSLLAMEFTRKLNQALDLQLPSTLLFDYPTIEALLNYLSQQLLVEFTQETESAADNLDDYSEQELSALLEQRLASMD